MFFIQKTYRRLYGYFDVDNGNDVNNGNDVIFIVSHLGFFFPCKESDS
jgi:hypothetical protein